MPGGRKPKPSTRLPSVDELPEPPEWLGEAGVAEWHRIGPWLVSKGLLSEADVGAFTVYCANYNMLVVAGKDIADFSQAGWIIALTARVDEEYAKIAGHEVVDLSFISKSAKTDREEAEAEVLHEFRTAPFVQYVNGVKLPVDPSTLRVTYAEPIKAPAPAPGMYL